PQDGIGAARFEFRVDGALARRRVVVSSCQTWLELQDRMLNGEVSHQSPKKRLCAIRSKIAAVSASGVRLLGTRTVFRNLRFFPRSMIRTPSSSPQTRAGRRTRLTSSQSNSSVGFISVACIAGSAGL